DRAAATHPCDRTLRATSCSASPPATLGQAIVRPHRSGTYSSPPGRRGQTKEATTLSFAVRRPSSVWEVLMRASVALVAAVLALGAGTPAPAQQKLEIRWGAPVNASSYYWDVWAAMALGYMDQEGLSIKPINNDTPIQTLQFLATGAIDISSPNTE